MSLLGPLSSSNSSRVYGSFPYDNASSVCLAGIHAGVITNSLGGLVRVGHWPLDWFNSTSQTIFPHGSQSASFSNGIQSDEVPFERLLLPTPISMSSFTVWSRGPKYN